MSSKHRANLIAEQQQEHLSAYLLGIAKNLGIEVLGVGGTENHVHILIALPSTKMLSHVIRDLKASSSRRMRENEQKFSSQESFGAFSVSPSQVPTVKAYIRNQAVHHRKRNFEEEFLALLRKSGISYDSKYVFG